MKKEGKKEEIDEKVKELTSGVQRTREDFENFRKQEEKQKEQEK